MVQVRLAQPLRHFVGDIPMVDLDAVTLAEVIEALDGFVHDSAVPGGAVFAPGGAVLYFVGGSLVSAEPTAVTLLAGDVVDVLVQMFGG